MSTVTGLANLPGFGSHLFGQNVVSSASAVRLGERLLGAGLLTCDELETALLEQRAKGLKLGEVLTQLGFVNEEDLLPYLSQQMGLTWVRLREGIVDPQVVRLLPRAKAESIKAIVLFRVRDVLTVAVAEPQNLKHLDEIERVTGYGVRPVLASKASIEKLIPRCYEDDFAVDAVTADVEATAVEVSPDAFEVDLQNVQSLAEGSPVVNLVNYIVVHAIRQKASDIHIEPGHKHSSVRFRVDGQLREVLRPRREFHSALVSRIKVMAKLDIASRMSLSILNASEFPSFSSPN
jgi:type IV pilus assembly protein PilB